MKSILQTYHNNRLNRVPNRNALNDLLKVFKYDKKIRLGANEDGGYVIGLLDESEEYDCYISCGISDEESFSRDFIEKFKMNKTNSFGFDGTILDYPYEYTKEITFIKKNIDSFNDDKHTNLFDLTEKYNNIFLKMDIEGGEYPWLLSTNESTLKKIKQITIEFHQINTNLEYKQADKIKCLEKLTKTHYLIHAHGNNCCGTIHKIPNVIELTYLNKDCFKTTPTLNILSLPNELDYPNKINYIDIPLSYPFVNL